ncbi:MAG: GspE/PulE family protein [Gemmatimonadaceae bacterium]|jgi:type IV pilus assembly protein PilB|nr:GspE/PulE family protein [Gemmatimonadaceae bacterium]
MSTAAPSAPQPALPTPAGATASAPPDGAESLEQALERSGLISAETLQRVTRIQARMESPRPIHEVLVEMGELTVEQVDSVRRRRRTRMTLADILREDEALDEVGAQTYREAKSAQPTRADRALLVDAGLVTEEQYLRALGARLDIPFVSPEIGEIQTDLFKKVPFAYLLKHLALPLRVDGNVLQVTVATPEDDQLYGEIERTYGMKVQRFCSTRFRISETLRTLERLRGKPVDRESYRIQYRELDRAFDGPSESGEEAVQLVDYLLSRAVEMGASDLHIEPTASKVRARVRVDGVLHHLTDLPIDFTARVVARIKILGRIDITEKRLHQDGKIHIKVAGREIDIRVSTYASVFGETVVMRLLDRDRGILPLSDVGFQPRALTTLQESVLAATSGLVLTVGPTGSGKTTTLYSFIHHANDPSEKVITCEDPVEYVIDGIVQCSVNSKTGPTFADSLRAIVRQDPDTIVVGEIRDPETAHLAAEAALTGHKVYSTFHTEDAVGAFVRFIEMGVEPFLVASTLSAVVAQRLVRRLCPECRVPHRPSAAELRAVSLERESLQAVTFMRAPGCTHCSGTGYKGRIAIHEVLVPDQGFREAVLNRASSGALRELARVRPEFLTMQEDGVLKALRGITSLAEVIENAPRDTSARPLVELQRIARGRSAVGVAA